MNPEIIKSSPKPYESPKKSSDIEIEFVEEMRCPPRTSWVDKSVSVIEEDAFMNIPIEMN